MRVFEPEYWIVNFNIAAAASITTPNPDEIKVDIVFRSTNDLVGLIWNCDDTYSHPLQRYESRYDLSDVVLEFDFEMSGVASLIADTPPTFTIEHLDNTNSYVRPTNYATSLAPDGMSGHIRMELANVMGGFFGDEPIDWTNVRKMFLSLIPADYATPSDPPVVTPLAGDVEAFFRMYNIEITGPAIFRREASIQAHQLRMTDGYDDAYHLAPKRIVDSLYDLGYRDWYNCYIGLAHHHNVSWSVGESRFIVDPAKPFVNKVARAWWDDLVVNLVAKGFSEIVLSVSYEIIHYQMPLAWRQLDHAGNPGRSGWVPPSEFISPCNFDALDYLAGVANYFTDRTLALGGVAYFQIGEPWWWDNAYLISGGPCFYDAATQAAYVSETGNPVPTPFFTSTSEDFSAPAKNAFVHWLADKLGESTLYLRDAVRAANPAVICTTLVFTPQVLSTEMLSVVNLPVAQWLHPAFDIMQIEDYDWLTAGDWTRHALTYDVGLNILQYPKESLQFFSGFVLNAIDADVMWPCIYAGIREGYQRVSQTWVWARPQVWRDGIVWQDGEMITVQGD